MIENEDQKNQDEELLNQESETTKTSVPPVEKKIESTVETESTSEKVETDKTDEMVKTDKTEEVESSEKEEVSSDQPAETELKKETEIEKTSQSEEAKDTAESSKKNESEEESHEEEENDEEEDEILMKPYDEMNLAALSEELERLLKAYPVKRIRNHVREIKSEFDVKFNEERDKKKEEFLSSGGNIIDFSYSTAAEKKFNKRYFEYKEKRDNYYKQVRKNLQENLEERLSIIEELKSMIGVGNDMNANFQKFKKLQDRWRKAGPVPRADYKDTWSTYHHHVERFYEFLHLDREFRELDYRHNLEQKQKMIDRAEELVKEPNVNRAFRELQNLHRMWKEEVGPVSNEYSDAIWDKFSAATKKIHENRKEHYAKLDEQREDNLIQKQEIVAKIKELENKEIKSHRQAQNRIKEFKTLRDQFFKAGRVPSKNNQEIWDAFKGVSRDFNHKKNEFYKSRKQEQKDNLDRKLELIKIAEDNKDGDDFDTVTPLMKKIQADWKKIGFVDRSKSDKIWKQFKAACNHYFDRLHSLQNEKDKEAVEAYEKKENLLNEVKTMTLEGNRETDLPKIKAQIEAWKNIGRVPQNKKGIEKDFNQALDKLFKQLDMNRKETELLKYENRLQTLENSEDDYKIEREANFLRKKIDHTSNEIRQLETNLEFFSNADENNPLMKDVFKNIEQHKQQLKIWEAKLNKLKAL